MAVADLPFGPGKLEVARGTYVRWANVDDSVMLRGQAAFMKLDAPGTCGYICGLHANMKGKIAVR